MTEPRFSIEHIIDPGDAPPEWTSQFLKDIGSLSEGFCPRHPGVLHPDLHGPMLGDGGVPLRCNLCDGWWRIVSPREITFQVEGDSRFQLMPGDVYSEIVRGGQ